MKYPLVKISILFALMGGAVGLLLSWLISTTVVTFAPPGLPRLNEISMDGRVLAFTAAASLLTALICGLLPAFEISGRDAGHAPARICGAFVVIIRASTASGGKKSPEFH